MSIYDMTDSEIELEIDDIINTHFSEKFRMRVGDENLTQTAWECSRENRMYVNAYKEVMALRKKYSLRMTFLIIYSRYELCVLN